MLYKSFLSCYSQSHILKYSLIKYILMPNTLIKYYKIAIIFLYSNKNINYYDHTKIIIKIFFNIYFQ